MEEKLFDMFEPVSREKWQEKIITDLKGKDYEQLNWQAAGLGGAPIFTREDLPAPLSNLANAHEAPELFGARHWVNYQWIAVSGTKEANSKALSALNQGADGLVFLLNQLPDWQELLKDIETQYCHLGLIFQGEDGSACMESFHDYCHHEDIDADSLQGFFSSADAELVFNPNGGKFCQIHFQVDETLSEGLPVIELACQLAQAADLFDQLTEMDASPSSLFSQTQFQLSLGDSYFAEIAKYRAMRGLVTRFASAYGLELQPAQVQILAMSSDWTSVEKDPHSHMLHATTQAMSAIIGGADAICLQPFYPVFDNQELAERAARNISTILREESYLSKVIDPSAGTYFIESLTAQLSEQAWQLFLAIEAQGGISQLDAKAVKSLHTKLTA